MSDKGTIVELFGFKVMTNSLIPKNTVIVIGDIAPDDIKSFTSIADVLTYLLEKEKVYVFNAIEKIGKGFKNTPPVAGKDKQHG